MVFEFPFFGKKDFFWNNIFSMIFEFNFAKAGSNRNIQIGYKPT
jgi:hypothetical protein